MNRLTLNDGQDYLVYREGSGGTLEIFDIAVTTERRAGHGKELVQMLLDQLPPGTTLVFAITRAGNYVAQRFYHVLGFRIVAVLHRFYGDGAERETAIMYGKDIVP